MIIFIVTTITIIINISIIDAPAPSILLSVVHVILKVYDEGY